MDETTLSVSYTVEFECTSASMPFVKRVLNISTGTEVIVGRIRKNSPEKLAETLLFDTRALSREHAKLFLRDGKLYISDLNSHHGTFVNKTKIPTEGTDGLQQNAQEVKTGDIVQFSTARKTCSSGELLPPIEGRLTLTQSAPKANEQSPPLKEETRSKVKESLTPFEGGQTEEAKMDQLSEEFSKLVNFSTPINPPVEGPELHETKRLRSSAITQSPYAAKSKTYKKWSLLQPVNHFDRGTQTDLTEIFTEATQTVPEETDKPNFEQQWLKVRRDFSSYRVQSLKIIIFCLLVAIFYQCMEASVKFFNQRGSKF